MARYAGKFGKVLIGTSTELGVTSWKAKHGVGESDVTDTTSAGFGESLSAIERVEWTLEAVWKTNQNPYLIAPTTLTPSDAGPAVKLFVSKNSTNPTITMPVTFISDVDTDLSVPGEVKYTITGKSQGTFTIDAYTGS